jgi:GNAT superfamily N-acetyltransferase
VPTNPIRPFPVNAIDRTRCSRRVSDAPTSECPGARVRLEIVRAAIPVPRSLVWATALDVLPPDRVIERRSGFLVIRSPSNPTHYWGNLLLFDRSPRRGDGARWEALFDAAFEDDPRVQHRTFSWDQTDGNAGAARAEFADRGYLVGENVGLIADADQVVWHPRENREVIVRTLDSGIGSDEALWDAVVELQLANREDDGLDESEHRAFIRARLEGLRALLRAGRGAWYVAIVPTTGDLVASCGIVVTAGRGRFQLVDTALPHRRRGISSRLVVEAARRASIEHGATRFVIEADPDYHALGLYESLGFERAEVVVGACLWRREG